ncbi:MAG: spermine/spermidine synthase [bacterium]|nr:spermine/spermidine synthase [bacterium]
MDITYETVDKDETSIGTLELRRYTTDSDEQGYEILIDGSFLMASHGSSSERAMAQLSHDRLDHPKDDLRVLVGGLGAGHTLRAALELPGTTSVTVVEISEKVVEWNHLYFASINGCALQDDRVAVFVADLFDFISQQDAFWDLLLLDLDNGPGWLASPANQRLYQKATLRHCLQSVRSGGVLAIWSPGPNAEFHARLNSLFSRVEVETTSTISRTAGEPSSTIYLVVKQ